MTIDQWLWTGIAGLVLLVLYFLLKRRGDSVARKRESDVGAKDERASLETRPLPDPELVTRAEMSRIQHIEQLENLLEKNPDNPEMMGILAYQYLSNRQLDKALRLYQKTLKLAPGDASLLFYMGNCFYLKGQLDRAKQAWKGVIEVEPKGEMAAKAGERLKKLKEHPAGE